MLYELLSRIGYHHPLHPALAHLPIGLTIAGFLFIIWSGVIKRPNFAHTAEHCAALALLAVIPTAILGYLDWQHFYKGAFLFPIKMKLGLALSLFVLLFIAVAISRKCEKVTGWRLAVYMLCFLITIGLGYFGGELDYGKKRLTAQAARNPAANADSILAGVKLFEQHCSFCHFTDSTETKVGPGLKGFFQKDTLTFSGWPVSTENVARQLKTPFGQMPPFERFSQEEINSLTDFLKTI